MSSRLKDDRSVIREYVESALVAILVALLARTFIVAAYKIPTGSMTPTLRIGDCIFSWKIPYGVRIPLTKFLLIKPKMPHRGDVIVFRSPEDSKLSLVKRVVAIPGDRVEIKKRILILNGKPAQYVPKEMKNQDTAALRDYYQVFNESFDGHEHLVMFRRGQEDEVYGPEVVPEGMLFVLGDNRDSSEDSRYWGMVPIDFIEGRAFLVWLSLDWDKKSENGGFPQVRWSRFFKPIY